MATIASIHALEILDSRGTPTLQVSVKTDTGIIGTASVPSGASTGAMEAHELRDGDPKRYGGKGVLKAAAHVNGPLMDLLRGEPVVEQRYLDEKMILADGTKNKSYFGANAILGVSMAIARARALTLGIPLYQSIGEKQERYVLPCPMMNIVNGGAHADNSLDIQEIMIRPRGAASFAEAVRLGTEIFHTLKSLVRERGWSAMVGDEGGLVPQIASCEEALDLVMLAIERAGFTPGQEISLALDVAASWFYDEKKAIYYDKKTKTKRTWGQEEQIQKLEQLARYYPIDSIEDGLAEGDFGGWRELTKRLGSHVQIVGDDLFVTNREFLQKGIQEKAANAILIKPNQIGTLTETLDCIAYAKQHGYQAIISHRSGETEDSFLADLCVGTETGQVKTGSLSRSDRTAKYNRLLTIADELQERAVFQDGNLKRGCHEKN
ncbi:MAG: phosphopyruvate hydratase [Chlamydiae bacterium]|nr:phosphopyruvate hydratase [Chlamydiota bacterium]